MTKYTIKLIKKEEVATETMAFHFEKPKGFTYIAGQFGEFTLINPAQTDDEGNTRSFSLTSAPYEKDVVIATRMRETAFKRVLKTLPIGSEVIMDAPYGNFVVHKNIETPAIFLTGGIGITPVRSILAQTSFDKLPQEIVLFYSNKTPDDAAILEELQSLAKENPHFTFVPLMTRVAPQAWNGPTGHLTKEILTTYVKNVSNSIYYLSGPAGMVKAMRELLNELLINRENIKTEEFPGY